MKVQERLCKGLQKVFRSQKFQGVWIRFRGALQGVRVLLGSWIVLYRTGSGEVFGNGFGGGSVEGWFVAAPRFCGGLQGSREEVYGGAAARTLEVGQVARCFPDLDRVSGRFVDEHSRWSRRVRRPRPGVVTATDGEGSSVM